ncbi:trigger factor [Mycoplasma sp. 128]|uniref:trigger factor n=1 Tax=Mycoplasma sp. 3341 TaxID=3447506 RepID=UPI003F6563BD
MLKRKIDKKKSELSVSVEIEAKVWQEAQEKARKELRKKVEIKGFRKGKVPAAEADKYITEGQVQAQAVQELLPKAAEQAATKVKEEDFILDAPEWNILEADKDKLVLEFVYPLLPEVKLGEYKDLGIKLPSIKVSEKDVEEQIQKMLKRHAMLEVAEDLIQEDDRVNFNFKGFVDGEAFDGGEAENFDIIIGSKQFIPGFEDNLKKFKKGDEGEFDIVFPKDYHMEYLRDKKATFKIKVNEVKRPQLSELNDEFVKTLAIKDVNTVEELKSYLKDLTKREKIEQSKEKFASEIMKKLLETSEYPLPDQIVRKEMSEYYKRFEQSLKQQGASVEQYLEVVKSTKEKLAEEIRTEVVRNLKISFTYTAIAKAEDIKVEDADYENEYSLLAKLYNMDVEEIKKYITKEQIQLPLINKKIIATLAKYNDPKNYKSVFGDILLPEPKEEVKTGEDKKAPAKKASAKKSEK